MTGQEVRLREVTIPANGFNGVAIQCPAGKVVTGGGFEKDFNLEVLQNFPADETTWVLSAANPTNTDRIARGYAICVDAAT